MTERPDGGTAVKCSGCGIAMQTTSPDLPGYIPEKLLTREPVICQRCFRIKNYNETSSVTVDQDEFLKLLSQIGDKDALVIHIVDIFDFEGSLISGLQRFVGSNPVVLAVNKTDLLPKVTNWNKVRNWVQKQAKEQGLRTEEIVLCSAKKNQGFDRLLDVVSELRGNRDVYVVGATNVGKSTLINRLIRDYSDMEQELTTSRYPGTTLDMVNIPLDDGKHIIDTPGIVYPWRFSEIVSRQDLSAIMPDKPLKPAAYQLDAGQTLFFGGMARFDFVDGQHQSFTCYINGGLKIHRTKLERADQLFADHAGELLSPPTRDQLAEMPEWTRHEFRVPRKSPSDIYISGLGWIRVNSENGALVAVHAPRGVRVLLRPALI
ncbi:ribosome biogenesis GTPase YqeH [Paenibacillus polymyxa]|jgi:ribosome biogenesis GTPase YqeH|uniref:GTP-binding protein engA n=1 Tax=Paenibacillus polymyxa TaxID=1406 RepID=A0A378Y3T4_PAEPO|nr:MULTISPECIES: ribosome biogenesis GTPase YqeH [Paenibacillus]KAF6617296.1 ribosome biogenesis GTPase YqeH [Paenibacillus sp. EKM101P]KAF6622098.1 ribosome biogenesis GTPase YqeH [Paenibacillus sp. EKM102P]KAF6631351.1 ribosome biogenesis GTPase YqeH [Paenibacillus sp. EKM10P]KAF6650122.1 ribosome biogenesis GTPase YqeH [Paenibacillus sp. EKM11P]KAF6659268.1 ribosome biogenesis GTPase YqeH [Paenibacillus sp. EKM301P]